MPEHRIGTTLLGRYRVTGVVALGGQSVVYTAQDLERGDKVAVKIERGGSLESAGRRLEKEAEVLSRVRCKQVVGFRGAGWDPHAGRFVLAEELIPGTDLSTLLSSGDLPTAPVALRIINQVARGLEALHRAGFIMRDLTPGQVMVHTTPTTVSVVLVDLGLTRRLHDDTGLTEPSALAGTPGFIAPELIHSTPVTPAADVYSLAVVAWLVLTGTSPFPDSGDEAVLTLQMAGDLPELEPEKNIPAGNLSALRRVLCRSLSPDPENRPGTPREFARLLERAGRAPGLLAWLKAMPGRR